LREGPTLNPIDIAVSIESDDTGRLHLRLDDRTQEDMWLEIVINTRSELMESLHVSGNASNNDA
jgi:hypothetical protein